MVSLKPFALVVPLAFVTLAAGQDQLESVNVTLNANVATPPRWIGPFIHDATDTACYRKAIRGHQCPIGYEFDHLFTCWARCPIEFPVKCGMECLPQNADCTTQVLKQAGDAAQIALKAASTKLFDKLVKANEKVHKGVKCGREFYEVSEKLFNDIMEIKKQNPSHTKDQVLALLAHSDFVIYDLPQAVSGCLDLPIPSNLQWAQHVVDTVNKVLEKLISEHEFGKNPVAAENFVAFTQEVGVESVRALDSYSLEDLITSVIKHPRCGFRLVRILKDAARKLRELKKLNPSQTSDEIRLILESSELLVKVLPDVALQCANKPQPEAFKIRDRVLKVAHVLAGELTNWLDHNGKPVTIEDYVFLVSKLGLDALAEFDTTGIVELAKDIVHPICRPTAFIGEIDDGPLDQALALKAVDKAFAGSEGTWTKAGDGKVQVTFTSVDRYDVKVNIYLGGSLLEHVVVKKGQTVVWSKPIDDLQQNALYMDRWRPGFFGIPGTGGGSLVLWVPHSESHGHLELHAKLNPTD